MADRALYRDGHPQNLAAAAADALDWLKLAQEKGVFSAGLRHGGAPDALVKDAEARLSRCIAALDEHLAPCRPPVFETSEAEEASEAQDVAQGAPG